jgi:hypothetical protein
VHHGSASVASNLTRRKFLKFSMTGAALAGAAGLSACEAAPEMSAAGTTPKSVALYRDSPNQGRRRAGCTHFMEPNGCEIVAGESAQMAGAVSTSRCRLDAPSYGLPPYVPGGSNATSTSTSRADAGRPGAKRLLGVNLRHWSEAPNRQLMEQLETFGFPVEVQCARVPQSPERSLRHALRTD